MRLAVTGADGHVGRALAARLTELGLANETLLIDREAFEVPGFTCAVQDLAVSDNSLAVLDDAEIVCHLAALPGGAAERDPVLSRKINCDLPLAMIERLAGKRLIVASSIAVYGSDFGASVDDETPAHPNSAYGTHKRMVELAFADAARRNAIKGAALRLSGVVARQPSAAAFGSAFLSDIFHAIRNGEDYTLPVSPGATNWILSTRACARQLAHAMLAEFTSQEALMVPATFTRMESLVAEIARHGDATGIVYAEQPDTQRIFGSYPPLRTERALCLGFDEAEQLPDLVEAALAGG